MAVIPTVDNPLCDLVTFSYDMLRLLMGGVRNSMAVTNIIHLIERMEELRTKAKGILTSHLIAKIFLFDIHNHLYQFINRCLTSLTLEYPTATSMVVPFYLEKKN